MTTPVIYDISIGNINLIRGRRQAARSATEKH